MKRQFPSSDSTDHQEEHDTCLKKLKGNPQTLFLDQLSEECFDLVLMFLGVLKKVILGNKKKIIRDDDGGDEENTSDDEYDFGLKLVMDENQLFVKHVLVDWKQLKNISLISRNLFSRCAPIMFQFETAQVGNQVFDHPSEFFKPIEADLTILDLKNKSDELKSKKIQQWELWFSGKISHLHNVESIDSQNELKEKVLNRASYSFEQKNQQMNGKWEISAYCHLLDDLHLYHGFECGYDNCTFSVTVFGDLQHVNLSIKEDVMKYLDLPSDSRYNVFKSEDSDEDFYDEDEEKEEKYNSLELMTSEYVNSIVNLKVLNYIREKLGITSQVTDLELVSALVYAFPYDITVKSSQIMFEEVEFDNEQVEIDFTIAKTEKKQKEISSYNTCKDSDISCKPCEGRSIFDIGHDMLRHILTFLRFRYVATLSETNKTFYNVYLTSGWSFPIRISKIIQSLSPIMNKQAIEKSLSIVREARYDAYSAHPYFVKYLESRYANIDYLSSVKTIMKVGNRIYSFEGFDDEGSRPYFTMDDITNGKTIKLYSHEHDFYCTSGDLVVREEAVATLQELFGNELDKKDLVKKFIDLLPWDNDSNWRFVSEIRIGKEPKKPKKSKF